MLALHLVVMKKSARTKAPKERHVCLVVTTAALKTKRMQRNHLDEL
jgi:hypothetical protein